VRRVLAACFIAAIAAACHSREPAPARSRGLLAGKIGYVDESADGAPRDGGTLYRRLEGEPATLNPILQTSDYEAFVISDVSRNLLDYDKKMEIAPGLCDRWSVSPDHRVYTFHLRDEAVWEDGSPVTAHDAVFTIRKIVDPSAGAVLFSSGFDGLEKAEELGPKTFRTTFAQPYAFQLQSFNVPILPARVYEGRDIRAVDANRAPVSNGPYRVASWRTSESIELVRNEKYWGPRAHFARVVFRILPDPTQSFRALEKGEIDEMRLSTEQYRSTARDLAYAQCCRTTLFYDLSYFYIGFNNRLPMFSDVLTRRAIVMLLDRGALARDLFLGGARVLSGPWAADSVGYDASVSPYPYDPSAARALLAKAGWKDVDGDGILDRDGRKFDFELLYGSGSSSSRQVGEILKRDLGAAGIVCRPRPMEWAAFEKRMDAGEFDAVASAWSGDPNPDLFAYWHSSQAPPNGLNNLSYKDPAADRLMERIRTEFDPSRRRELLHELHRVIHDDAPAIFVLQGAQKYGVSKRIGGLVTTPMGLFKFWPDSAAWWDRAAAAAR
jgi:peptide/nickel transport system substrate-binding protein